MNRTYVLFLLGDHAYHRDDRPAVAAYFPLSNLRVNALHFRTLDRRIPLSVFDHRYLQPHLWWGSLGRSDQATLESTLDTRRNVVILTV